MLVVIPKQPLHEPDTFFLFEDTEISEKTELFCKSLRTRKLSPENFSGQAPTESLRTQDSDNVYGRWVQQMFDLVLVAESWVSVKKWGPLAKLWGVQKNRHGHNFQNNGSFWNRYFENCGRICFFEHLIILLTYLILLQSPNFGRPKQGQTVSFGQPNSV